MPELQISTDKIEAFIEAAREVAGKVRPTTGDRTTTGDDSNLVTIEDYPGDPRRDEMSEIHRVEPSGPGAVHTTCNRA